MRLGRAWVSGKLGRRWGAGGEEEVGLEGERGGLGARGKEGGRVYCGLGRWEGWGVGV